MTKLRTRCGQFATVPLDLRFWAKVDRRGEDECWPWLGATNWAGYGLFQIGTRRQRSAHRVAWQLANGAEIPGGLYVCHACDAPGCVNPKHLWLGTNSDNVRDAMSKGRMPLPGMARRNAAKTHCYKGHPFDGPNTLINKRGTRVCLTCRRASDKAKSARYRLSQKRLEQQWSET